MTDKQYKEIKARIDALYEKWSHCLGLKWWKIKLVYHREDISTSDHKAGNHICQATTQVDWEYGLVTMTFNCPYLFELSDDDLESIFVHECCHILVHEMREWSCSVSLNQYDTQAALKHEERVVCALANAFIWTRKAGAETLQVPRYRKLKSKSVRKRS